MRRQVMIGVVAAGVLSLGACRSETTMTSDPAPAEASDPAPWETIDPSFQGCGGGG